LAFLDEECLLGQGTDQSFIEKIDKNFASHEHFERKREKKSAAQDMDFVIKHYAGDVKYNADGFLDKVCCVHRSFH
jgi:myosin heavy subunit